MSDLQYVGVINRFLHRLTTMICDLVKRVKPRTYLTKYVLHITFPRKDAGEG